LWCVREAEITFLYTEQCWVPPSPYVVLTAVLPSATSWARAFHVSWKDETVLLGAAGCMDCCMIEIVKETYNHGEEFLKT